MPKLTHDDNGKWTEPRTDDSLLRQAERNVVNRAKVFDDIFLLLDALQNFGYKFCSEFYGLPKFKEGMKLIREALKNEHYRAISDCFNFVGIGGEEAAEYSREQFKKYFNDTDRVMVMHFLDKYGRIPSSWEVEVEDRFRREASERIEAQK